MSTVFEDLAFIRACLLNRGITQQHQAIALMKYKRVQEDLTAFENLKTEVAARDKQEDQGDEIIALKKENKTLKSKITRLENKNKKKKD